MTNIEAQFFWIWPISLVLMIIWEIRTKVVCIHHAVLDGNLNRVRSHLDKGVNVDLQNTDLLQAMGLQAGVTPLYLAATNGRRKIAELLIDRGADLDRGLVEEDGVNPLLGAAILKQTEIVDSLLVHGAKTGLHFAVLQGNINVVRTFLEQQTCPINSKRNGGMTSLHLAAIG